jgi:hypothetical protein
VYHTIGMVGGHGAVLCVSCNNLVSSGCFGMIVCVCKLKTEQKILQYCEGKPIYSFVCSIIF